jgi:MFS family permease
MPGRAAVLKAILRNRRLVRVELAFLLFSISEWATWVAIVVFAYGHGGATEAGVVACILYVPSILVAPAASVIGDRLPRSRMLAASYAIEAVAFLSAGLALLAGPPVVGYALATLAATCITLTRPAHSSLAPEIVSDPDELAAANVASGTIEGLGALVGPALTGVLVSLAGPATVYLVASVATVTAFLCVLPLALAPRVPGLDIAAGFGPGGLGTVAGVVATELRVGLRTIGAERRLVAVLLVLTGSIFLLGALNVFYAVIAIDLLGLDTGAVGYLAAVTGLGAVLGAAGSTLLVGRERLAGATILAAGLFGVAVAALGITRVPILVVAALAVAGAGWAFVYVEARTLAQRLAGDDVMSRVFGVVEALMMASQAVGALFVPVLVVALGPASAIVVAGLGLCVATLLVAPVLLRADRIDPERIRRLRALRAVPMFAPLAAPVLERLAEDSVSLDAAAGEPIVSEGEVGDHFYVIVSGTTDVTVRGRHIRRLGPGDSFGEIALIHDVARTATVRAHGLVALLAIERRAFLDALTGQPRSRAVAADISTRRLAEGSSALLD